jgi:hypothetical protein
VCRNQTDYFNETETRSRCKVSESSLQQEKNKEYEVRPAAPRPNEVSWTDKLADEQHKPVRRHFRKRRVLVRGTHAVWAVNLIDMQHYAKDNDNIKFILAVIDDLNLEG